jgi:hypothetical protein
MSQIQTSVGRIIAALLCVVLPMQGFAAPTSRAGTPSPLTVAALQEHFPGAQFIAVDARGFADTELSLRNVTPNSDVHLQLVRNADDLASLPGPVPAPAATPAPDCMPQTGVRTEGSAETSVDLAANVLRQVGHGSDRNDAAVVMFVLIGAVVVVALVVYSTKYFYDAYAGFAECPKWWDLTLQSAVFSGDAIARGALVGLRLSTGVQDISTRFGLTAELGRLSMTFSGPVQDVSASYWMVGPALRWYDTSGRGEPWYLSAELLGGSANNRQVGTVSAARLGLNFPAGAHMRLGLSLGALYTALSDVDGALAKYDNYYYLLGLELGARF